MGSSECPRASPGSLVTVGTPGPPASRRVDGRSVGRLSTSCHCHPARV